MTTQELILMTACYLVALIVLARITRTNPRRLAGALAGDGIFGIVALLGLMLGEARNWWRVPNLDSMQFKLLLWLGLAISCAPVYLITWRVARRFGALGLALCVLIAAIIGPPRDYFIAAMFPQWMVFSPGLAPVLANAAIYALLVLVGHAVMRLVAGPSRTGTL
jgi:hypothetical protein